MKYSIPVGAFVALVTAQELPWAVIDAADPPPTVTVSYGIADATTVVYNSETAIAVVMADLTPNKPPQITSLAVLEERDVVKRGPCDPQALGAGPTPEVDTAHAFLSFDVLSTIANSAPIPNRYALKYRNLNASSNAYGYIGFTSLDSYDTNLCASRCTAIHSCLSFNIFFERDPAFTPADACPDPANTTFIKCVFWGGPTSVDNARNTGVSYYDFEIVLAGSNAYDSLTAAVVDGYTEPVALNDAAIDAPPDCGGFNTYNRADPPAGAPAQTCQFFNTYLLLKNGLPEGQVCTMYLMSWEATYSSNSGQWRGNDHYTIAYSFSYANKTDSSSPRIPCPIDTVSALIAASTLQPYCSPLLGYTAPVVTSTQIVSVTVPSTTIRTTFTRVTSLTSTVTSTVRVTTLGDTYASSPTVFPAARVRRDDVPTALQTFSVTIGVIVHTTRTTVTATTTTFVAPDPTNTMWISPSLSDAGKYVKTCYGGTGGAGGMCQSNFAPDRREGFRVTDDHYLYSTTYNLYYTLTISGLYNARESVGFGVTDKSQAAAVFYTTSNGDGTRQVHLKDPSNGPKEFYFCYYNQYVAPYSDDLKTGWLIVGYSPTNGGKGNWCIPTTLTIDD
ncbi:hypothetical protein F5Y19DRAFT_492358 [Xylariaceae sp. FL1651]|nr:hypothetical protein F5Y19DRAFT_492358 [Xylariaceae sp. FL1651]